jgi:preprotein translocase subunit YajC|tara:strand:- start:93 stop:434 length:342 start_codon:yes stop_codon:yes gene_type:complete
MIDLIATAHAADAGVTGGDAGWINLLFLGGFVLIFYFLLIRPQNKRRKEHQSLISSLNKGDEIATAGGIVGKINKVEDDFVILQVGPEVSMRIQKTAVGAHLPKGTIKSLDDS